MPGSPARAHSPPKRANGCARNSALLLRLVELCLDGGEELVVERSVGLEDFLRGVAALGELAAFVAEPGTALFDDSLLEREVEERAGCGDALVVHDVELGLGEGRGDFVL